MQSAPGFSPRNPIPIIGEIFYYFAFYARLHSSLFFFAFLLNLNLIPFFAVPTKRTQHQYIGVFILKYCVKLEIIKIFQCKISKSKNVSNHSLLYLLVKLYIYLHVYPIHFLNLLLCFFKGCYFEWNFKSNTHPTPF